jgi:transposase InsO family protein
MVLLCCPNTFLMIQNVSREFCWPTVARDCARYVSECLSCSAVKPALTKKTRPLQLFLPSGPWKVVCADILGPLPMTPDGNRFVLVFSDRFSKYTVSIAMKTVTTDEVAEQFVSQWVAHFGVPVVLLTDNGPQFASRFLQQVSAILGVQQRCTSAYHPATNGQVGRFNRSLLTMLSHYVGVNRSWDKVLGAAMAAY